MGLESYRTGLRAGAAGFSDAVDAIRGRPYARPDWGQPAADASCFVIDDGRHLVEVEVSAAPVRVSCRFTLCNPPTVDNVFIALLRSLMERFGMEARSPQPDGETWFTAARFSEFEAVVRDDIRNQRELWIRDFGPEQLAATTREAFAKFILPKCEPARI